MRSALVRTRGGYSQRQCSRARSAPTCPRAITWAPRRVPETTADGRWIVVDGRRWRATDPAIPEADASRLRRWLMAARRDVGTTKRAGDEDGERRARERVHAAQRPSDDQARSLDKRAFVDAVSGAVHSVDAEEVERQVEQVLRLLREWLPEHQVDRTLEQLPGGLAELMR